MKSNKLYVVMRRYKQRENDRAMFEEIVGIFHSKEKANAVKHEHMDLGECDVTYHVIEHNIS